MTIIRQKKYIFKQQLSAEHGTQTVLRFFRHWSKFVGLAVT